MLNITLSILMITSLLFYTVAATEGSIYNVTEKLGNETIIMYYDDNPVDERLQYPECYYDKDGYPKSDKKVEKCLFKKLDKEEQEYQKMIKEIDEDEKEEK